MGGMPPIPGMSNLFTGLGARKRRSLLNLIGNTGMGGIGGIGGMGMQNLFGGSTINPNEVCPAVTVAKNCMDPGTIKSFDMMQKMMLERQCAAKNCCWDNDRYQKVLMMQSGGFGSNLMCAWRAPDYSMYNMPSLAYSLRGCCDYSPCVERTGRDGTNFPGQPRRPTASPPAPEAKWSDWGNFGTCSVSCGTGKKTRYRTCSQANKCAGKNFDEQTCFTNCDPVVWSAWQSYGCSRTCGGGYETLFRTCISGPCPNPSQTKHNQPCNMVACNGGWSGGSSWFNNLWG